MRVGPNEMVQHTRESLDTGKRRFVWIEERKFGYLDEDPLRVFLYITHLILSSFVLILLVFSDWIRVFPR